MVKKIIAPISSAKENSKMNKAIGEVLRENKLLQEQLMLEEENKFNKKRNSIFDNAERMSKVTGSNKKVTDVKQALLKEECFVKNFGKVTDRLISAVVLTSLPIDESSKADISLMEEIGTYVESAFVNLKEAGVINLQESPLFRLFSNSIAGEISEIPTEMMEVEVNEAVENVIRSNFSDFSTLVNLVSVKSVNAVGTEKRLIKKSQILEESLSVKIGNKVENKKTLFRAINESKVQSIVNEGVEQEQESILETSLLESLVDYAFIETLSTSRLIAVDPTKMRNYVATM